MSGRRTRIRSLGALALALAAAGACTWTHDDYPDRSCTGNADCFRAQGEICDRDAGVCVTRADAAPEADAAPASGPADASVPPDAGVPADAETGPDGAAVDAAAGEVTAAEVAGEGVVP